MSFFQKQQVAVIGDLHIGVHQNSEKWHKIALQWSEWLRDQLTSQGIKDIVICGDFWHDRAHIDVRTMDVASDILNNWSQFNIIILCGNHDSYLKETSLINSLSILEGWTNITVIESEPLYIEQFDRKYAFVPWGADFSKVEKSDIIFGHFEIQSFKMNNIKICDHGLRSQDVFEKSDRIFTGHFHLREERVQQRGHIVYVGNPFQMDFHDEGASKGYYLLDLSTRKYKFVKNNISPKHFKISLSYLIKQDGLTAKIKKAFEGNIVKFIIDRNISPDDVERLFVKLMALNPLFFTPFFEINFNKFSLDERKDCDLSGIDIQKAITEFIDMLEIENKQDVKTYTLELYKRSV